LSQEKDGVPRENYQGVPSDATGVDRSTTDSRLQNDQQMPKGGVGREGGAAGKFTRPFREGGEPGRPGGAEDLGESDADRPHKS